MAKQVLRDTEGSAARRFRRLQDEQSTDWHRKRPSIG